MRSQGGSVTVEFFTTARAAALGGISQAMLNYLCREKLVTPSVLRPRGHGSKRGYSFGDVVALRLIAKLSAAGVSVQRLRKALAGLRKLHPEITLTSLPGSHVVSDGRDIYVRGKGDTLERAMDGQYVFAFVIELAPLRDEVVAGMLVSERAEFVKPRKVA
jgi:DNA-binding transcriptional MerR regulator